MKPRNRICIVFVALLMTQLSGVASGGSILIEAEAFADVGAWVLDQQFMDQMGSPFLLAHGLGVPVADATTTITVRQGGTYRVWVRTRDWVATWGAPGSPGRFQVLVNDVPLDTTFGTEGAEWHWQDGGTVQITESQVTIGLHALVKRSSDHRNTAESPANVV